MAGGDRDAAPGDIERRAGNEPAVDAIAQCRDTANVRAEITQGRESGFQRAARVVDPEQQRVFDIAIVLLQARPHLVVVVEDVDVHVDQPRQHELLAQIDQPGATLGRDETIANRFDPAIAHDQRRIPARCVARTIEQRARMDVNNLCRRRLSGTGASTQHSQAGD